MNINEAKDLKKLTSETLKEIKAAQRKVDVDIAKVANEKRNLAQMVTKDKEYLFKFAKNNSPEQVRALSEKMMRKWQSQ